MYVSISGNNYGLLILCIWSRFIYFVLTCHKFDVYRWNICFFRLVVLLFVCEMLVLIELSLPENLQQIVVNQFSRVVQHERCSFFGNVTLGSSISLAELRELYHVVRC